MATLITRDELRAAIDGGAVTVLDTLGGDYYADQHLPGALALTPGEVDSRAADLLPDRDAAIVTYCSNPACGNSGQVAARLTALGYRNVRKYREGIQDWVEAGLPVESGLSLESA
ncbi:MULTISPECIES: rhodanese-like domain-containing protein [Kitasatospora]|uniref:Rhodanese-related sulfurtransferase n=2 Tax=Kitasatospora TaxID=2063 RepID=A0ABT1J339_9ACTN|nr:rhodanese-like domain-containing protein [Kitasatospora paracochleata]MCP2311156.1 rhodanese-related sulfurtransferase [Kitasatospora paracochleata]